MRSFLRAVAGLLIEGQSSNTLGIHEGGCLCGIIRYRVVEIMLLETKEGFDYTGADCCVWMREAGFKEIRVEQLTGIESMVVGVK